MVSANLETKDHVMSTEVRTSKRPTHRIYAVAKRVGDTSRWTDIGAAWPHSDGNGFNLKLEYLPLNGSELVIRVPKDKSATADTAPSETTEFEGAL